jgi:uncharacterized protein (DUF1810 family)
MNWAIYLALAVGVLASAAAAVFLAVRVLQAWRAFKRLRRRLGKELDRLEELTGRTAASVETASDQAKLTASIAQLRVTLERFAVLRSALDEATDAVGRITSVYPRKS